MKQVGVRSFVDIEDQRRIGRENLQASRCEQNFFEQAAS